MKKILLLILTLCAFSASAQQKGFYSPGVPPGSVSRIFTDRIVTHAADSLADLYLGVDGNKFYNVITRAWYNANPFVAKISDFEGAGTTSDKFGLRDTLLKTNWVVASGSSIFPQLTLISNLAQPGLTIKNTETSDGRAIIKFNSTKNNQIFTIGVNLAGQNKAFGIRRDNGIALPDVDYLMYVEPFTDTMVFPHQIRMKGLPTYTGGASVVYIKNGFLEHGPAPAGTTYTFSNGLTNTSGAVKLGGALTGNTTITTGSSNIFGISSTTSGNNFLQQINAANYQAFYTKSGSPNQAGVKINGTGGGSGSTSRVQIIYNQGVLAKQIELSDGAANVGIVHTDLVDSVGDKYLDTNSFKYGKRYNEWIPNWGSVKSRIDSAITAIGGGAIVTGSGLSGTGTIADPAILGGTVTGVDTDTQITLPNPSAGHSYSFNILDPTTFSGLAIDMTAGGISTTLSGSNISASQSSELVLNQGKASLFTNASGDNDKQIILDPSSPTGVGIQIWDKQSNSGMTGYRGSVKHIFPLKSGAQYAQMHHVDSIAIHKADSVNNKASGVTAGSYTATNLTVDATGRITAAANGTGGGSTFTRQVITSGTSATVTGGNYLVTIDPSSTIATYALTMPASPSDLDVVEVDFGGTLTSGMIVTALTVSPNSGQTILDNTPPGYATADNTLLYRYRTSNTTWYRFKP